MEITINSNRLWGRIQEMARIGATNKGGCNRQALTDLDREGRDLFCSWAKAAGCTIRVDTMGNIFAQRAGTVDSAPAVISGSHLDTQPTGGKFDGVYGVLAAMEVIDTLNDHDIQTDHAVEAVVWTNEEGARFAPAMIGSGVFCGEFDLAYAHGQTDKEGATIGGELERIGYAGSEACEPFEIKAAFEVHIEQGPILEAEEKTVGVVTGVQGMRWFDISLTGDPVHAGPTPMDMRNDPMRALYKIVGRIYEIAEEFSPESRATFGDINALPGARNTVPENITVAVDIRNPDEAKLDQMETIMRESAKEIAEAAGVRLEIETIWKSAAVVFDKGCVESVRKSVALLGISNEEMISGAGHDSVYLSRVAPTSMIFIPCAEGISHNEAESAEQIDVEAGANVLLHAILDSART